MTPILGWCARLLTAACLLVSFLGRGADKLAQEFVRPPDAAKPWVYWFWLNGNITRAGITADLEAMKRVGIGGVLIMEVDQGAPQGPVDFMGEPWRELFKHVVKEARRLDLEVNMNNDAGWNGSGGPWIKPEQSMQEVVFVETNLAGPMRFEGKLAAPKAVAGFYRDISVLAFPKVSEHRIPDYERKASFQRREGPRAAVAFSEGAVVQRGGVVDISLRMDENGRLVWDVPAGEWTVVRFGHTSTGVENAPAPRTGRGLECDKLSREGIDANFTGMMAKLIEDSGMGPKRSQRGLVATHIDSWENGVQNWTPKMREEFWERRGYHLGPFMPVLTGRVVDSPEISERFLWDLRQTISELVIDNYAGHMRRLAQRHGLRFTVEAYGAPCDSIPYAGRSDEPMAEFWTPSGAIETCKGMSSAGHIYGLRVIGAEAFTAADQERWLEHPALLKAKGDEAFCLGINRFVFHRYALQPWTVERVPGMTMGPWGQHYERTQTWWDWTGPWHEYLARCQLLLREGLFVADICYLQPEAPPQGPGDHPRQGYDWDECGAEAVLTRMKVKDGRLVLPDGMSYRVLALSGQRSMTPQLLRKIRELVQAGATVIGPRPLTSPSLNRSPQCDEEVQRLGIEVWGGCDGAAVKENTFGKGRVLWGPTPEQALLTAGVQPDFVSDRNLRYIHRQTTNTDIYFVANPAAHPVSAGAAFRVTGMRAELWDPETGQIAPAPVVEEREGRTFVGLNLGPAGSVFVVFRKGAGGAGPAVRAVTELALEGKRISAAQPEPLPRIVVKRATYGVPGDPQRTMDVTERVQRKVDSGDRSFVVVEFAQPDPAPNVVKTLAIDYEVEGHPITVKGLDQQTIRLTSDPTRLTVGRARYGVLDDPKRTRDVREKLQRLLDAGERKFPVARMAEGDDPAFLVVKTLEVEYTADGEAGRTSGRDPDLLEFGKPQAPPPVPAFVSRDAKGRLQLVAEKAGVYEVGFGGGAGVRYSAPGMPSVRMVEGSWNVRFTPGRGAVAQAAFNQLISWSEHADPGVKYFSGTAAYSRTVDIPREMLGKGRALFLDLGSVEVMARVKLNGEDLGMLWKRPYRVEITRAARAGSNKIEIQVVNLWPNRLIGDEHLPEDSERNPEGTLKRWPDWLLQDQPSPAGRHTFTSWRLWKKSDALRASGLIGPVRLVPAAVVPLE